VIHIHDMPFPMPAIPLEHPLFDTYLFWNEAALVKAFLLFNSAFQVIQCQSQLHQVKPEVLKKLVPIYDSKTHFPSSLWLSRLATSDVVLIDGTMQHPFRHSFPSRLPRAAHKFLGRGRNVIQRF
jgi:hypothetical protein